MSTGTILAAAMIASFVFKPYLLRRYIIKDNVPALATTQPILTTTMDAPVAPVPVVDMPVPNTPPVPTPPPTPAPKPVSAAPIKKHTTPSVPKPAPVHSKPQPQKKIEKPTQNLEKRYGFDADGENWG